MFHFFAIMLWAAGLLAIVAGMPQLGIAIFVVVILNGIFAFAQEYRAERAADRLRDLVPRRATALRDDLPAEIDAGELVPGDVVLLKAGDRVSADLEIIEAHDCSVDTSTLTGESVPAVLVNGQTAYAGTAHYTVKFLRQWTARPIIAAVAVSVGVVFMAVAASLGMSFKSCLLFAIGVTVALVPEGLLPTVSCDSAAADLEYVRGLGAERVVDYRTERFEESLTGVDVVLDTVGGDTQQRSLRVLKPGGILVSVVSPVPEPMQKSYNVRAVFFYVEVTTARLNKIAELFDSGRLVTDVGTVLPLEQARTAHEMLGGAPHKRGKIVLRIAA